MSAATRIINPAVANLFRRVKQLEDPAGGWNGADAVSVLCEWFTDHGINPDGDLDQLAGRITAEDPRTVGAAPDACTGHCSITGSVEPHCNHDQPGTREQIMTVCECGAVHYNRGRIGGPEHDGRERAGTAVVYVVQRDTVDGLYLFSSEADRDIYSALFAGVETGTATVINRSAAAQLIIDSQPCPGCGDQTDCGPCLAGDPGCDALDCQNHDSCLPPITTGTGVHLADEDPTDSDGPEVLIGIVADPTEAEASERYELTESGAKVLVEWPHHRRWEDRADLTAIDDDSGLYR